MQRFGATAISTDQVGLALLQSDWQKACDLILGTRDGDPDDVLEARKIFAETKDAKKALSMMPKFMVAERARAFRFRDDLRNTLICRGSFASVC